MQKYYIIASGGIDSGITGLVLKTTGYPVEFVHFVYGQRSWLAELYAIYKLSKALGIPLKIFDVTDLYKAMDAQHTSFLMDPNAPVYSGLKQLKKSVAAWVPGRNMLFATITATYAESEMLQNKDIEKAYIASGWAQLSECIVLDENQEVLTECDINGTETKPITEIKPGDKLFIANCESPDEITTTVKKVAERILDQYQYLRVEIHYFSKRAVTLKVGPHHKFVKSVDNGTPVYVEARDLKPGDTFIDPYIQDITYKVIENLTINETVPAIDLYCEPVHGFYLNGVYTCNSGSYPDNSERFNAALEKLFKFGLVKGHDIQMTNVLANLMKYEEWILGKALGFPFEYTCSCDNPRIIWNPEVGDDIKSVLTYKELMSLIHDLDSLDNLIDGLELCVECGSTRNSRWAAYNAGIEDPRRFYESKMHPEGYDPYEITFKPKFKSFEEAKKELPGIIDRLCISEEGKQQLRELLLHD